MSNPEVPLPTDDNFPKPAWTGITFAHVKDIVDPTKAIELAVIRKSGLQDHLNTDTDIDKKSEEAMLAEIRTLDILILHRELDQIGDKLAQPDVDQESLLLRMADIKSQLQELGGYE